MAASAGQPQLRAGWGELLIGDGLPVRIMGVINVSPESFFKGSVAAFPDAVSRAAEAMTGAGADCIDVGAMSTAPYLETRIPPEAEAERMVEAVTAIRRASGLPISADTQRAVVARAALAAGAAIINDVSGLLADEEMAQAARSADGVVLMATELAGAPGGEPVGQARASLEASLARAEAAGIDRRRIVVDPGIGFFRHAPQPWFVWDAAVLQRLGALRSLGLPILAAVSRKSFIGRLTGRERPDDRLSGSLAATAIAVYNGAHMVRTHDVAATRDAVRVAERLRDGGTAWNA
ncbi:MAG TPA: dihydropteroate synthase [Limnochordia bacterium]|nr:dihydropteroate synthase [Limnochordia bacterium]